MFMMMVGSNKTYSNMDVIKPDYSKEVGSVYFELYGKFAIVIPIDDWAFMCEKRWFSDEPKVEDVEAEFGVCGAREALSSEEANNIVRKTIAAYKRMMQANGEDDDRKLLDSTSKTVVRMDKDGKFYFED